MTIEGEAWQVGQGQRIALGGRAVLMGILNVTPDSFSDGGHYEAVEAALAQARRMVDEGATIVDVGGESTRPGAEPVTAAEEQRRVLPVVEAVCAAETCLVSIDTYRAETARLAVAAGAHIVNDVWGAQREPEIARVAAQTGAGLCLMHTGREREKLRDVIEDQLAFLRESLRIARGAGVPDEAIVLDPGFGFAKNFKEDMSLLARFAELRVLSRPFLVGTSRKRFLRRALGRDELMADIATAATSALLRERGAAIFRVHDVAASRDALAVADAMLAAVAT